MEYFSTLLSEELVTNLLTIYLDREHKCIEAIIRHLSVLNAWSHLFKDKHFITKYNDLLQCKLYDKYLHYTVCLLNDNTFIPDRKFIKNLNLIFNDGSISNKKDVLDILKTACSNYENESYYKNIYLTLTTKAETLNICFN